jgi:NADH-quinone oxidoreductase subunit J
MNYAFDPSLRLYVYLADAAFVGFAALALVGGIAAVGARRIIHAVLGLATSLVGVAGLYVYLGTHFIAAMQILIYVGAVCISLIFAVMLARPPSEAENSPLLVPTKVGTGFVVALFAALVLGSAVLRTQWTAADTVVEGTITQVGERLLTNYALVFELISLILLVAIVGSVVLASRGRGTRGGH